MSTKPVSRTITRDEHWLGPAIHPGEMLLEEYLRPLGVGQVEAARKLGVSLNRLNEIVLGKRGITADTALRLARFLKTSPQLWMRIAGRLGPAPSDAAERPEGRVRPPICGRSGSEESRLPEFRTVERVAKRALDLTLPSGRDSADPAVDGGRRDDMDVVEIRHRRLPKPLGLRQRNLPGECRERSSSPPRPSPW